MIDSATGTGSTHIYTLSKSVRNCIREKLLVFTVTTGRSGTGYLASLLARLPNTTSRHEPDPNFATVMRQVQTRPDVAQEFWCEEKFPFIAEQDNHVYVETSHLFCKGFFEPLLSLGVRPALIFLRREPRDVARSLHQLGTIPGRTEKGSTYLLYPDDPNTLFVSDWKSLTDYQLCFWYCLEIDRRAQLYRALADRCNLAVSTLSFSALTGDNGVLSKVAASIGAPKPSFLDELKLRFGGIEKKNTKRKRKSDVDLNDPREQEADVYRRMAPFPDPTQRNPSSL